MSVDRLKATGLGRLRMRVAVEGWPEEFVSSEAMERAASGTTRARLCALPGAREEVFTQKCNPLDAIPESEPTKFRLIDHGEQITRSFYLEPSVETWLKTDVSTLAGGTFSLKNASGISVGKALHINREAWEVTAVDTVLDTVTVTRSLWDTRARYHYTNDGDDLSWIEVTDRPRVMTGRYVFVYLYGEGDSPTGEGVLWWRGRVSSEPKSRGGVFTLSVDPVSRVLEGMLGQGLGDPLTLRGVKYDHGNPLDIEIRVHSSTAKGSSVSESYIADFGGSSSFYETQGEFGEALQGVIDSAISAATGSPLVNVVHTETDWWLEVEISSTTPRYITVVMGSAVDGETIPDTLYDLDDAAVSTVAAGDIRRVAWDASTGPAGARGYPRGAFGIIRTSRRWAGGLAGSAANHDLYIDGSASIANTDAIMVDWPSGSAWPKVETVWFVDAVDVTARKLTARPTVLLPDGTAMTGVGYTAVVMPEITISRTIARGSLYDAIANLITDSATYLNLGEAPMMRDEDTDTAEWLAVVNAVVRGRPSVGLRGYVVSGEVELREWLKQELRLLGLWLGFDATGRFVPRQVKTFALTDPELVDVAPLDAPEISFQRMAVGSIKGAVVKTGYAWMTDEWRGRTHVILDVQANSRNPLAGMLDIAPRSIYDVGMVFGAETAEEIKELTRPVRAAYGYPYDIETFSLPLTDLDTALVGLGVRYTPRGRELPDAATGTRNPVVRAGQVLSRTVDFGRGLITVSAQKMVQTVYGYTPGYYIASESYVAGNQWTLTVDDRDPWSNDTYSGSGDQAEDFLEAGDLITIYQWNNASPTTLVGEVDSVAGDSVTVTFTSAWTPGSTDWMLGFQDVGASETENMLLYAWFADEDFVVGFTAGDAPARRFAP